MSVPVLPESAPFSPAQRAWLNGFFAGVLSLDRTASAGDTGSGSPASDARLSPVPDGAVAAPGDEAAEEFPWHDPTLSLAERLELAVDQPVERRLMAAMAQLDCGTCGYQCRSYARAIADGTEKVLTKCTPGGSATARKVKEIMAGAR